MKENIIRRNERHYKLYQKNRQMVEILQETRSTSSMEYGETLFSFAENILWDLMLNFLFADGTLNCLHVRY